MTGELSSKSRRRKESYTCSESRLNGGTKNITVGAEEQKMRISLFRSFQIPSLNHLRMRRKRRKNNKHEAGVFLRSFWSRSKKRQTRILRRSLSHSIFLEACREESRRA